ncbi:MAG: GTPase, partial [Sediminibacterium sp.]
IRGILFRLIDTAGIRFNTEDVIEQMGVEKSLEKMRTAQLVVYLMDVQQFTQEMLRETIAILEKERVPYLIVLNKIDVLSPQQREVLPQGENILQLSAKDKQGLVAWKVAICVRTVEGDFLGEATIITNERHVEALRQLHQALQEVDRGLQNGIPGDLLALDIRSCLHHLGSITGTIAHDEQLEYIFSKFCIGK